MSSSHSEFVALSQRPKMSDPEMVTEADRQLELMRLRRTVRDFSDEPVPRAVIEKCLQIAGLAPSGANLQPWHFCVVSDPQIKRRIREEAEIEEREFYTHRAPAEWLAALQPLGTDEHKPFLETAPYLIVIFAKSYDQLPDGRHVKNYYVSESVGIATGFLIRALHQCGLATLTHTPSPMAFLNQILNRPKNERPVILLVVGHPAADARVPNITKKSLHEIASFHDGRGS